MQETDRKSATSSNTYTFVQTVFVLFVLGPRPKFACLRQVTTRKSETSWNTSIAQLRWRFLSFHWATPNVVTSGTTSGSPGLGSWHQPATYLYVANPSTLKIRSPSCIICFPFRLCFEKRFHVEGPNSSSGTCTRLLESRKIF